MKGIIHKHISKKFTNTASVIGYIMIALGFAMLFDKNSIVFGILIMVFGAYMGFSYVGILINLEKQKFKHFVSHFGIKKGEWKSFKDYPYITVLTITQKQTIRSLSNSASSTKKIVFQVHLLNETHWDKILISQSKSEENEIDYAESLAKDLGLEYVTYSPQISEASRNRRR